MREYDLIAEWYAAARTGPAGLAEVTDLAGSIPRGSRVLDIGCGTGLPLTRALLDAGLHAVGLDGSREMLARFRVNCGGTPAVRAVVQACPFRNGAFDAAVAWGVLFHLTQPLQVEAIASVSRVLKPGGRFLFTAGDVDGSRDDHVGVMNGVEFHYYSFTVEGYRRILDEHGLALVDFHRDSGENRCYLARKSA